MDDDPASLELIQAVIEPLAPVTAVETGEAALAELERGPYSVVLLDIGLPDIDGFETVSRMRESPAARHTPVIFLTGQIGEEQVRRGYALGAADYLLKPFEPEILRAKVKVFVDLMQLRYETEVLGHRALHDPLTGLPNRTLFTDRLEHALARLTRRAGLVAVLFLDLDGFKAVNDGIGHEAGDRLLVELGNRLRGSIRASDTASRFGGDEFLVLLEGLDTEQEINALASRIRSAVDAPYSIGGEEVHVSAAIGIAMTDDPDADVVALIRSADASMFGAKRPGADRRRRMTA